MKSLRTSKFLAAFGALAVVAGVSLAAVPAAEAGGYGYNCGYRTRYVKTCYPRARYVAPVYPTYRFAAPVYTPAYYPNPYFGHGCYYPW